MVWCRPMAETETIGLRPSWSLPSRQRFQRIDALIEQILSDNEHHRAGTGIDRHQHAPGAAVIAELHRVGDVADADIALRRGDNLTCLDAAAALHEFAVEAGFFEIADPIRNELRLIDRHRDRVDHPAGLVFGPRSCSGQCGSAACNDRQRTIRLETCAITRAPLSLPGYFLQSVQHRITHLPRSRASLRLAPRYRPFSRRPPVPYPRPSPAGWHPQAGSASCAAASRQLKIEPSGLAMPLPAISGALPCTGS